MLKEILFALLMGFGGLTIALLILQAQELYEAWKIEKERRGQAMFEVHVRDYSNGSDLPTVGSKEWHGDAFKRSLAEQEGWSVVITDKGEVFGFSSIENAWRFRDSINSQSRELFATID